MTAPADLERARFNMIEQQIRPWDVLDLDILELLGRLRREEFVPLAHKALAFVDMRIPLTGKADEADRKGWCMLEPRVEARMLQDLKVQPHEKVLEVGAGSGYMAALLAQRAQRVISLELKPELVKMARENLQRAGIPVSEISMLLEKKPDAPPLEEARPADILRRIPIFRLLEEHDLNELAKSLRRSTFAPGELLLRQGDPGDSMYFVLAGRVGITYRSPDGAEQPLATFDSGDFFGEVSLLTGEVRGATATAMSRVICYCLDKAGLQRTMEMHPHLAEDMSVIMAHRQTELNAARDRMDRESALRREAESQTQMLARIRRFFGISGSSATAGQ